MKLSPPLFPHHYHHYHQWHLFLYDSMAVSAARTDKYNSRKCCKSNHPQRAFTCVNSRKREKHVNNNDARITLLMPSLRFYCLIKNRLRFSFDVYKLLYSSIILCNIQKGRASAFCGNSCNLHNK